MSNTDSFNNSVEKPEASLNKLPVISNDDVGAAANESMITINSRTKETTTAAKEQNLPIKDKAPVSSTIASAHLTPSRAMEKATAKSNIPVSRPDTLRRLSNIEDIISPTAMCDSNAAIGTAPVPELNENNIPAPVNPNVRQDIVDLQSKLNKRSLKRSNLPPPLGLHENTDPSQKADIKDNNKINIQLKSNRTRLSAISPTDSLIAPYTATIPGTANGALTSASAGISKPRVRYLGKIPKYNVTSTANTPTYRTNDPNLQRQKYAMDTMMLFDQQQQLQQQLQQQQQQQQQQYMMMMGMYHPAAVQQPHTANPYMYDENVGMPMMGSRSTMMQSYPQPPMPAYAYYRGYGNLDNSSSSIISTDPSGNEQKPDEPNLKTTANNNSSSDAHINDADEEEDEESADLAIESDALPTPIFTKHQEINKVIQGEVRIMQDRFSFEFPANDEAMDKKMFLSICNKVWKEAMELEKSHNPNHT